jgi:hypothetical protein
MVDGKTQLFADLMIANLEFVAIAAAGVFVVMLGVLMAFNQMSKWALQAERGDFDEPSD